MQLNKLSVIDPVRVIDPATHPAAGSNINGPSLIKVPSWISDPLGAYYLYFAAHKGEHIRLAYAHSPAGPYTMHAGGTLGLAESGFPTTVPTGFHITSAVQKAAIEAEGWDAHFTPHIASPDAIVDHDAHVIRMAYHGLCDDGTQLTRIAESIDGLSFTAFDPLVTFPYLRVLPEPLDDGTWLGVSMPGVLYRSTNGRDWEAGPFIWNDRFRHCAITRRGETLHVFWSQVGDAPECILHSTLDMVGDWSTWVPSEPTIVRVPEESWEGTDLPVEPSVRGQVTERVHQLRDPAIFEDGGTTWLLYSYAGESGIAMGRLEGFDG